MNSLSWMIYAAEALGGLKNLTLGVAIVVGVSGFLTALFFGVLGFNEDDEKSQTLFLAISRKWWIPVVVGFISVALPSPSTVYLIAASEAGETVVKSPEAQEIFTDLKTIIKQKLKEQISEVKP